jgi:hypothetical protein
MIASTMLARVSAFALRELLERDGASPSSFQ